MLGIAHLCLVYICSELKKNGYVKATSKNDLTQKGEKGAEVAYSSPPRIV